MSAASLQTETHTSGEDVPLLDAIKNRTARVGVVGLGYVGLPLAVSAAKAGFPVTGFDVDPRKIEMLSVGTSYIGAVSDADLAEITAQRKFDATTDSQGLSECSIIIICVPTPLTKHREPNLEYVVSTAEKIAAVMSPGTLVVLESTTYPGTTEDVLDPILASSGLQVNSGYFLGYSPEREDPGNTSYQTTTIPKIVAGHGETASRLVEAFYASVVETVVAVSSPKAAEAVKITENVFRAVNIALVNELKIIFERLDIDIWEVIDGAATKPFGYMPFYPGPGLGGHCIPIDPFYLTWRARGVDVPTRFIELAGEINTRMPMHVVDRTREVVDRHWGKGLSTARILVVGIAYKKNVSDMRESPSMRIMELLTEAGASVEYCDPLVAEIPAMREHPQFRGKRAVPQSSIPADAFEAILIATDHDEIDYAALVELGLPIIDTRNAIERRGLSSEMVTKA